MNYAGLRKASGQENRIYFSRHQLQIKISCCFLLHAIYPAGSLKFCLINYANFTFLQSVIP